MNVFMCRICKNKSSDYGDRNICKDCRIIENREYRERRRKRIGNELFVKQERERYKGCAERHNANKRLICLYAYGVNKKRNPFCNCCGDDEIRVLTIDHIIPVYKTKELRKKGITLYCWLIKNDFPKTYQILCRRCNISKWRYEKCRLVH
jgi:hypothetical protein